MLSGNQLIRLGIVQFDCPRKERSLTCTGIKHASPEILENKSRGGFGDGQLTEGREERIECAVPPPLPPPRNDRQTTDWGGLKGGGGGRGRVLPLLFPSPYLLQRCVRTQLSTIIYAQPYPTFFCENVSHCLSLRDDKK